MSWVNNCVNCNLLGKFFLQTISSWFLHPVIITKKDINFYFGSKCFNYILNTFHRLKRPSKKCIKSFFAIIFYCCDILQILLPNCLLLLRYFKPVSKQPFNKFIAYPPSIHDFERPNVHIIDFLGYAIEKSWIFLSLLYSLFRKLGWSSWR
jgi:hypothetical protein